MKVKTLAMVLLVAMLAVGMVSAASVVPSPVEGNPTCADLGYDHEFKIDPPVSGTYMDGKITFTLHPDGKHWDWSSSVPMDAVVSKGGPRAYVYAYDPASYGDNELVSPLNNGGKVPDLSHASFCWDEPDTPPGPEVPEFGTVASLGILGAAGLYIARKRR